MRYLLAVVIIYIVPVGTALGRKIKTVWASCLNTSSPYISAQSGMYVLAHAHML